MPDPPTNTQTPSRLDGGLRGEGARRLVRLVREDLAGRVAAVATLVAAWFALGLLDPAVAVFAVACAGATWLRLRALPPPQEPDPDDWL